MNSMLIRMQNVGPHHKALCSSFAKRDSGNTYLEITVKIMLMILLREAIAREKCSFF